MRKRISIIAVVAALPAILLATGALAGAGAQDAQKGPAGVKKSPTLFTVMTGRKEVDAEGRRGAGDPEGRGSFTAIVTGDQLCYGMTVAGIDDPIAAHIHRGRANQAGGVVLPLAAPEDGDPGTSSACTAIAADLAAAILKNPRKYYVNVHTEPYPGGAVRGQLTRRMR